MITEQERRERIEMFHLASQHLISTLEEGYRGEEFCWKFRPVITKKLDEICEKTRRALTEDDINAIIHEYTDFVVNITGN